jgi:hypothetical protein
MALAFTIRRNDHLPTLDVTLSSASGSAVNLSTASSVAFHMATEAGAATKVNAAASITDATNGVVSYSWVEGDTDTAGVYAGEFEVVWNDGRRETFPNTAFIDITITEDLA